MVADGKDDVLTALGPFFYLRSRKREVQCTESRCLTAYASKVAVHF